MKPIRLILLLFGLTLLVACGGQGTTPSSGTVSKTIPASSGGTLEVGGAKLSIPPGALDKDSTVKLTVGAKPQAVSGDPLSPAGAAVGVDLGGGVLSKPADLTLPAETNSDPDYLAVEEVNSDSRSVHAGATASSSSVRAQGVSSVGYKTTLFNSNSSYSLVRVAPFFQPTGEPLKVPFFWQTQDNWWSSPTALAMMLNYFVLSGYDSQNPLGTILPKCPTCTSLTYPLPTDIATASKIHLADKWPSEHLKDLGTDPKWYIERSWDAGMIGSKFFKAAVMLTNAGFLGVKPRPVLVTWLENDGGQPGPRRAQLVVGSSDTTVWINDPRDRWSGSHPYKSWPDFYAQKFYQKDGTVLRTTVMSEQLLTKPQTGSLELSGFDNSENPYRSLVFFDINNQVIAAWNWRWPYESSAYNGPYFSEVGGNTLPLDPEVGRILPISSALGFSFKVVNLTPTPQTYTVDLVLPACPFGASDSRCRQSRDLSVAGFDRADAYLKFDSLVASLGAGAFGLKWLELSLRDGANSFTERHAIKFKIGPNPSAFVRIASPNDGDAYTRNPGQGTATLALKGSGQLLDGSAIPNAQLQWSASLNGGAFSSLGAGSNLSANFGPGQYQLKLEGSDGGGTVVAVKTISFSVQ